MIRLFLDESVHPKAAAGLRDRGVDAQHVVEAPMIGAPDGAVLAEALSIDGQTVRGRALPL